ncbi:hypothetical protein PCASD_08607 [Puccinia coronata f. sp. avenae]|uniref:Uncharacterized protein n=1 Tax=Puccinia coronata f. sp. avenae TaxID=200324 RepID=A0A2N5UBV6_9BASI|nr:hypothetical protein PCASD_08607 [Puccinia coronata f. sp. avenae]
MPVPPPHLKPQSMISMIAVLLSAVIVATFITFFIYLRRRRVRQSSRNNNKDLEESRLSQVTGESEPSISPVETSSIKTPIKFKMMGLRFPRFETSTNPLRSDHASVHNASPAPSTFQTPLPTLGRRQSDPESLGDPQLAMMDGSRRLLLGRKDRHRRKRFGGQSLDSKLIDLHPCMEPPAMIELPQSSMESTRLLDKSNHIYSPFNEPANSMGSLLEMSPMRTETCPSTTALNFPTTSTSEATQKMDRLPDLRITGSSIVEPNDTWWQLPFPPRLSPIKSDFELPDLASEDNSDSLVKPTDCHLEAQLDESHSRSGTGVDSGEEKASYETSRTQPPDNV